MIKKILVNICRIIFAVVFIFSGFVKAVDPLGFTYKMEDYLADFDKFFNLDGFFSDFSSIAFPLSIVLVAVEFLIGINLLLAVYRKKTTILAILFMCVMTPLTFYVAMFSSVTDCGCFGDALIISNWETFYKNIVLLAMAIILFVYRREMPPVFSKKTRWFVAGFAFLFPILLSIYCYRHLPIIDFRPYKIGANIPEKMVIPEGAPQDSVLTVFTYEKDGVQKNVRIEGNTVIDMKTEKKTDFTAFANDWKYVNAETELIKKGYEPPIHDFSISLPEEGDITEEVLADTGYTFLLISYKLEKAVTRLPISKELNDIYDYAKTNGYRFYCLNGSSATDIDDYIQITGAEYPMATTDPITLKTIIRSNPGLVLIKNGTIINKWHFNDLPTFDKPLSESPLGTQPKPMATKRTIFVAILFLVPLLLVFGLDKIMNRRKNDAELGE